MDVGRIDGLKEIVPEERPARRDPSPAKSANDQDAVSISPEAQRAAEIARLVSLAKSMPDVREVAIVRAQSGLRQGVLMDDDVLRETARRVLRDLEG